MVNETVIDQQSQQMIVLFCCCWNNGSRFFSIDVEKKNLFRSWLVSCFGGRWSRAVIRRLGLGVILTI
jgi:hypothetical protein